ncbi:MAG: TorF family putative porin [Planctomycetota bacterium]
MQIHPKNVAVVEKRTTLRQGGCQANISVPYSIKILLAAAILLNVTSISAAEEAKLEVKLDVTYLSSYIWRGCDLYPDDHSAIQPSIDVEFYDTGFGLNVLSSRANGSGFEDDEELDFTLRYRDNLFEGKSYATVYEIGWVYYSRPDRPRKGPKVEGRPLIPVRETLADVQELYTVFAFPELLGIRGLVPCYIVSHVWPAQSSSNASDNGGWIHAVGLDYGIPISVLLPEMPAEQILKLSSLVVYNSGVGATGMVDHDWSHAVVGLSTGFALSKNLIFTPGIYYQISMDDSINPEDEYWYSLGMSYTF